MDDPPLDLTTVHARRAADGDDVSLEWIVSRFTPLLIAQANYRMGRQLRARFEPEDVVQEVWAIALPRLETLSDRDGRFTPVLVRFLSTTLLHWVNNLIRRCATRSGELDETDPFAALPAQTRGPISRVVQDEKAGVVRASIEDLPERDREIVILRAIEQHSNQETAELLGILPNTAAQAYRRAMDRLRAQLPSSVFDELDVA